MLKKELQKPLSRIDWMVVYENAINDLPRDQANAIKNLHAGLLEKTEGSYLDKFGAAEAIVRAAIWVSDKLKDR